MACDPPALLRASLRRSPKFVTARPSPQPPRPAPPSSPPGRFQRWTLNYKWTLMVSEVPGTGQRHRTGASSGADFGFWHLSAREKRRRLGRFRGGGRFMGANFTQRVASERPMARGFPRCRPLRRDSCLFRRNGGDAERMPRRSCRSSRPTCLANVHASLRLCRWLLSVASGLASPSTAWERGSRRKRATTTGPQAGIGRVLA